jgi:hypothetical protein
MDVGEKVHSHLQAAARACRTVTPLRRAGLWSRCREQDGLQREPRRITEFVSQCLAQSVDNLIRVDSAAGADHVDQRVAVDKRTREGADVR